jgi:hypothetical protein
MERDHRKYEETLEAELLEFTGERGLHAHMFFGTIRTRDGRRAEAIFEAATSPMPDEMFRAFAHPSPFRPDHSERDVFANEPSAIWLENIEILPRRRETSLAAIEALPHSQRSRFTDVEASDLIALLDLRGVPGAATQDGTVIVDLTEKSTIRIEQCGLSCIGEPVNDPRPVRAILDYAKANWAGNCAVEGPEGFKLDVWAQAKLIGVSLTNYSLPGKYHDRADEMLSMARIRYMQMTQEPTPAIAARSMLMQARKPFGLSRR